MFELSPSHGQGSAGVYPPLAGSEWPVKEPSIPIRIVLHGLMGEIEVAGTKYNNVMSHKECFLMIKRCQCIKLRSFIMGQQSRVEITAEMVKEQRDKYPNHACGMHLN